MMGNKAINDPIRGRIAKILNTREVAINVGTEHGVCTGMYFDVMDRQNEDIIDPDSGKSLGSLQRPKVRVRIVSVQDKLSVASTYKKKKVNVGGSGSSKFTSELTGVTSGLTEALMPPRWITKHETLKTEEKTWEDLSEEESYVNTGDPVVQVLPIESDEELVETSEKSIA